MPSTETDERSRAYWDAIRRHVCGTCLDQKDDGTCGLTNRHCAIESHLPRLVEILSSIDSPRMDEYVAAVEGQICATCPEQDSTGRCAKRDHGECALHAYLSQVLVAVEEVNASKSA